jgi:hypothetical protein
MLAEDLLADVEDAEDQIDFRLVGSAPLLQCAISRDRFVEDQGADIGIEIGQRLVHIVGYSLYGLILRILDINAAD